jgi:arylformamidase
MTIWDISRALTNDLAPWPGDTRFRFELTARLGENAVVNVGAIRMGVHNGSHADATFHFDNSGATIDLANLEIYLGPATVLDLSAGFAGNTGGDIDVEHLRDLEQPELRTPRLLLKTGVWPDSTRFPDRIPVISPAVAEWLRDHGVRLVGLDLPSVDLIEAKVLQNHHALAQCGIVIVESLDFSWVKAGRYNLAALPLKISGGDAAPVRAVLWRD